MKNLDPFFKAKSVAVIGASREEGKIGNVVFKLLLKHEGARAVFAVNPNAPSVLGRKSHPSVRDIPEKVELAVICVPAQFVPGIIDECGKKGIRHAIIITSGFREAGNKALDNKLQKALERNNILAVGPNCLGVLDVKTGLDTLFLPPDRLLRPKQGGVSFISQSGALCSAVLDLAAAEGIGFAKIISYGNAMNVDESDYLEYLENDPDTNVICLYIEGVDDGKKFLATTKKAKKPIIVLKGGLTEEGRHATLSHTGSLAGSPEIYLGAFKQAGLVIAHDLEDVFDYLKAFSAVKLPKGSRVQVITNGGGYGIVASDLISQSAHLQMASLGKDAHKRIKKQLPPIAAIGNPIDVLGDATEDRYALVFAECAKDPNNDIILAILLPQTPRLNLTKLVTVTAEAARTANKTFVAIATGSEPTKRFKKYLEERGVPCYDFPAQAISALDALAWYTLRRKKK